jgi:DNA protecting protein DprA
VTGPEVAETRAGVGSEIRAGVRPGTRARVRAETLAGSQAPALAGPERTRPGVVERYAAALAGLQGMTPVRLAKLLAGRDPVATWSLVHAGRHPADPHRRFVGPARNTDVDEVGQRYARAGVTVLLHGGPGYPTPLIADPGAPAVLFALGDPGLLEDRVRVAIVGTRSATHYGRQVASELAGELADSGVVVVSGLARGIDGAAHAGVLRGADEHGAPPVAVVGTGLDVVYPSSNRGLWETIAARGCIFSESSLGTQPHPGVFPARNRIIAALSHVVVVVESHHGGGSLYTAEAAARRSIPVCAVPGSVRSRASDGTNALLVDGCTPVRDATDVLVAVSLAHVGPQPTATENGEPDTVRDLPAASVSRPGPGLPTGGWPADDPEASAGPVAPPPRHSPSFTERSTMTADQRSVWEAVDDVPTAFETILIRTDLSIGDAAEACGQLVDQGILVSGAGWWTRK